MRPSQKALLTMVGVLAGIVVVTALAGRVALSRSHVVVADGEGITGSPDLGEFDEIEVSGAWLVNLTRGDDFRIELPRPEDRGRRVRVHVVGDRLRLGRTTSARDGWRFAWGLEAGAPASVNIVMPELSALELKGSTRVALSGFRGESLDVDVAGAVRLEGRDARYEELDLSVAGASEVDLQGVAVTDARVELLGASEVVLTMSGGVLSGSMAGAGRLEYHGSVAEERVAIAGIARVVRRGE